MPPIIKHLPVIKKLKFFKGLQAFLKHGKWAVLWALLILVLCVIPGKELPHISFLELINFDKFVHASLFFVLISLTIPAFKSQTDIAFFHKSPKLTGFVYCVGYGAMVECIQGAFIEGRSADIFDFTANTIGCCIGIAVYNKFEKK